MPFPVFVLPRAGNVVCVVQGQHWADIRVCPYTARVLVGADSYVCPMLPLRGAAAYPATNHRIDAQPSHENHASAPDGQHDTIEHTATQTVLPRFWYGEARESMHGTGRIDHDPAANERIGDN